LRNFTALTAGDAIPIRVGSATHRLLVQELDPTGVVALTPDAHIEVRLVSPRHA
jgi:hypothetical protein